MRLWSIHPKYLDSKGLVALWREGLLAKKVLDNQTKGYRNHPQLTRFKLSSHPQLFINAYLHYVCNAAEERGYSFDRSKLEKNLLLKRRMSVTTGQIKYEWQHLQKKLLIRSPETYQRNKKLVIPRIHPLFYSKAGSIERWEVI